MCGIAGILGPPGAARRVKTALEALEYRGYDSCGIAWVEAGALRIAKAVGPVTGLEIPAGSEAVAFGHTRWATHGGVTAANAHPHVDCTGAVAVVHNGIVSNHAALRAELAGRGHRFASDTDSEVLAHLWEDAKGAGLGRMQAIKARLTGTYSIAVLDSAEGALYVAKERNPLWLAHGAGWTMLASDPIAIKPHATAATPLEDGDIARLTATGFEVRDASGRPAKRPALDITAVDDSADKAGYEHYMLKEIHEAPSAINRLLAQHLRPEAPYVDLGLPANLLQAKRVLLTGAGTSHHAALFGAEALRRHARVAAEARPSPEYKDDTHFPEDGAIVIALSQSGETLDTLQALHRLASHPHPVVALTNNPASSIGRMADHVVALRSGHEVSVAATKTFLSQTFIAHLLALAMGRAQGVLTDAGIAYAANQARTAPRALARTLQRSESLQAMARLLAESENLFILGKGINLTAAHEGALKLKEIAYQHAEASGAGELKHGPFALLTPSTPVVVLVAPGPGEAQLWNSIHEVKARGSPVFVLALEGCAPYEAAAGHSVRLPAVDPDLQPFVFASALHLLAYWVAKARALPIDRPRNLAKSVTVE